MNGLDTSKNQPKNIGKLVDFDFIICRSTLGKSYVDPYCDTTVQTAIKKNKCFAFYHFGKLGKAVKQADYFVDNTLGYYGHGVPVLDFEASVTTLGSGWVRKFVRQVYKRTKVHPWIYASTSTIKAHGLEKLARDENCMLWEARWIGGTNVGYGVHKPTVSPSYVRQYTSHGNLKGYSGRLDLDYSTLTVKQWQAYAMGDRTKQTKPPEKSDKAKEKEQMDKLKAKVNALKSQLHTQAAEIKKKTTTISKQVSSIQTLNTQISSLTKDLDKAQDDVAEQKSLVQQNKSQLASTQKALDNCAKENKKLQAKLPDIQHDKNSYNWIGKLLMGLAQLFRNKGG